MGYKYCVRAKLNGHCPILQEVKRCKTFIFFLITIIRFRLKYPIVDAEIRNGYKDCNKCNSEEDKPFCYFEDKKRQNCRVNEERMY